MPGCTTRQSAVQRREFRVRKSFCAALVGRNIGILTVDGNMTNKRHSELCQRGAGISYFVQNKITMPARGRYAEKNKYNPLPPQTHGHTAYPLTDPPTHPVLQHAAVQQERALYR